VSISAGILLQTVASTGAIDAEPVEDTPPFVAAEEVDRPPESELSGDTVDEMSALPTVAVGDDEEAPGSVPRGVPQNAEKGTADDEETPEPTHRTRLTARGGGAQPGGEWVFGFHGYFRAPMRVGVGRKLNPEPAQSERSVHYPIVPDDQYLSYQYTLHNPRDWAELYFTYGNDIATGVVSIQAFNFTDAAWKEGDLQLGVAQAFVALTPKFRRSWFDLSWKIGSFDNRYGEAGRYDAGEFETYLFGRTHGTGEAGRVTFTWGGRKNERARHTIGLEHGLAVNRPNPSIANIHRFTLLHHWHADYSYDRGPNERVEVGFHYLGALAQEADRIADGFAFRPGAFEEGVRDGAMHVFGPELRFDWGRIGYLYAGASYIVADHAAPVGPAIEVIHSKGGGYTRGRAVDANPLLGTIPGRFAFGIVDNYLQGPNKQGAGDGSIFTFMTQLEHSLRRAREGSAWNGEGWDVSAKVYLMYNRIWSDDPDNDGSWRLKYGFDVLGTPLPWLGVGLRFTQVRPHSRVAEQTFSVISPRLLFKLNWISAETIEVSYSRYLYNTRVCAGGSFEGEEGAPLPPEVFWECVQPPPFPAYDSFGSDYENVARTETRGQPIVAPDENVFMIKATFWW